MQSLIKANDKDNLKILKDFLQIFRFTFFQSHQLMCRLDFV